MAKKSYIQGTYNLKNPDKYKGSLPVVYRSSWEKRVFYFLDTNKHIISWGSESIIIPYVYKVDNKPHRYFVDINFTVKTKSGELKRYIIEIKPYDQTIPPKQPKRKTQKAIMNYNQKLLEYQKNQDKWEAASKWAKKNGYIFEIWTEYTLGLKN